MEKPLTVACMVAIIPSNVAESSPISSARSKCSCFVEASTTTLRSPFAMAVMPVCMPVTHTARKRSARSMAIRSGTVTSRASTTPVPTEKSTARTRAMQMIQLPRVPTLFAFWRAAAACFSCRASIRCACTDAVTKNAFPLVINGAASASLLFSIRASAVVSCCRYCSSAVENSFQIASCSASRGNASYFFNPSSRSLVITSFKSLKLPAYATSFFMFRD